KRNSNRNAEDVLVMCWNRLQFHVLGRVERFAVIPRVFGTRDGPKIAFGVAHDPALRASPVHEYAHYPFLLGYHVPLPPWSSPTQNSRHTRWAVAETAQGVCHFPQCGCAFGEWRLIYYMAPYFAK